METAAQLHISQIVERTCSEFTQRKSRIVILPKILSFLRPFFSRHDLDYATFLRLESKRTPQEMRRNGRY